MNKKGFNIIMYNDLFKKYDMIQDIEEKENTRKYV